MKEKRRYEFQGELLTAGEIARKTGIPQPTISSRLHAGKRDEALAEPLVDRKESGRRAMAAKRKRQREKSDKDTEMSQEEVAKKIGVSRAYVSELENSGIEKARRKLAKMGITKDDLL